MSRRGNWNRSLYKNNRPHGLRGKDIGLYYRDLQIKKNKNKEKDFMVCILLCEIMYTNNIFHISIILFFCSFFFKTTTKSVNFIL